jgi:5'-3' exonuclease
MNIIRNTRPTEMLSQRIFQWQYPYIQNHIGWFSGFPILIVDTFEADDVIGTLAKTSRSRRIPSFIWSHLIKITAKLVSEKYFHVQNLQDKENGVEVFGRKGNFGDLGKLPV